MTAPATLALPPRLDLTTAASLAEALLGHAGTDLSIDASAVTHLGTPGLQVLLSARQSWDASGHSLAFEGASAALEEQLAQFGLDAADLATRGAQAAPAPADTTPPEPPGQDLTGADLPGADLPVGAPHGDVSHDDTLHDDAPQEDVPHEDAPCEDAPCEARSRDDASPGAGLPADSLPEAAPPAPNPPGAEDGEMIEGDQP